VRSALQQQYSSGSHHSWMISIEAASLSSSNTSRRVHHSGHAQALLTVSVFFFHVLYIHMFQCTVNVFMTFSTKHHISSPLGLSVFLSTLLSIGSNSHPSHKVRNHVSWPLKQQTN
jgi:hypothetical protein